MKQRIFLLTLLFLLILTRTNDISAKETKLNEDMFTNVENTLKDKEIDLSYTQLVKQLIHGNVKGVLHTIKAKMKEVFLNRMLIQKDLIREILLIAFTAAIFKNLSDSFFQQSTANSAFYITYVILCGVMVHSFFYLNKTVTQLVTLMADYMKGMIMAYSLAVVSTSGITTSTTVYEFYLLLIYAMTTLTNVVLLPMIKILFVLKIINHISKEEHFSRLCKFSYDHGHRFGSCDQKQYRSRWHPRTDRDHRPTSHRDHSSCSYLSAGRDHDPAHIRQKDHRSDGCSHSKWEINAFDDLYDGTIIYLVRGIDRILNQR